MLLFWLSEENPSAVDAPLKDFWQMKGTILRKDKPVLQRNGKNKENKNKPTEFISDFLREIELFGIQLTAFLKLDMETKNILEEFYTIVGDSKNEQRQNQ